MSQIAKKCLFFTFNVFFWLAGLASIASGLWVYFDPGRFNRFLGGQSFTIPASLLIASGLLACLAGCCGCWGAIRESRCMLASYFIITLFIFCAQTTSGVLGFLYRENIRDAVYLEIKEVIRDHYGMGDPHVDFAVDLMQRDLSCCGAEGPGDYVDSAWWLATQNGIKVVPESCCDEQKRCVRTTIRPYKTGCGEELVKYSKNHMLVIASISMGLTFVQIVGMILTSVLFFSIESRYEQW